MTEAEVTKAYDVLDNDSIAWLMKNKERSLEVEQKLKPIKDVAYGDDPLQKLDIYLPQGAKKLPVLIDIHGGGWCMGSKSARAIPAEPVTKHNILWISIDYGLAPKHSLDTIIDHVRQAVAWVYKNIASYGGDPERIFVTGNSAGGHLAATTLMPGWHNNHKVPHNVIRGAICVSGIYDMESMMHTNIESKNALQLTLEDARRTSPLYNLPKEPVPVILAYGQNEPKGYSLEATVYAQALRQKGLEPTVIEVANCGHFTIMNEFVHEERKLFQALLRIILN